MRHAVLGDHARIELRIVAFFFSEERSVAVVNVAVEFVFSCRGIAYGYRNNVNLIQNVIEIVPSGPTVTSGA